MVPENIDVTMTQSELDQFLFFEHTRLMRLHEIEYHNHRAAADYRKFRLYQDKVDTYIKRVVKQRKSGQTELF